ncbi:MAG: helix-turn-helix domain-containing protein [Acidimicrobiales bacterium]
MKINPGRRSNWRRRFAADRLDGLVDAPRPGAARTIGDDVIEAVLVETLETAPPDAAHWSTRVWPPSTGSATPPSARSRERSSSSRGARTPSRSPRTPTSWRRSVTSSLST